MAQIDIEELREEMLQCRRCGLCREAVYEAKGFNGICPVWENTSGFETSAMRGKIMVALALVEGRLEKTAENAEALFQCTLCGNCTQICPAEFEPNRVIEQVRAILDVPNEVRNTLTDKIFEKDNPYDEPADKKGEWVEDLDFSIPTTGETIYFAGCTAALRNPRVARNTARILHLAGIDFAVMENEPCCGSVMMRTGKMDKAVENAQETAKRFKEAGIRRIIVSCAGCFKTLKKDYDELGIDMPKVIHVVDLANELIEQGKLHPTNIGDMTITYHDPCHLGREMNVYESPREILTAIPGVTLVEMETHHDKAKCCGAGGGLRSYDSDLSKRIASSRVKEAEATGADIIATACPFCETNLSSGAELAGSQLGTLDVVDILMKALGSKSDK
ncbi:MAG: (Fe-S)-binding protein [Candidatus Thorarchaeota archaeon]